MLSMYVIHTCIMYIIAIQIPQTFLNACTDISGGIYRIVWSGQALFYLNSITAHRLRRSVSGETERKNNKERTEISKLMADLKQEKL